ncbi:TlpA family protein disulfide reductase [Polaribacter sp. IC073]|uniref:TlpA family protein disulfide reductase n=1 Tax=Polaribacter sp. IC073 TaxID=2508540 RepID=UPI0011BF370D|nr:TlpA disulfide reductase family protein [Polaribacter sp. IC073]TXD46749.1 TlpA family protein disulfide reductase [Polaribacter sp. IC073]
MKNIFFIALLLITVMSCSTEEKPKDYAVISGTITNPIDSLRLRLYDAKNKKTVMVAVDAAGNFRDTLKLDAPVTFTAVYKSVFGLYLENNMNLNLTLDSKEIAKSISFSGNGEIENNFLRFKTKKASELYGENYKEYLSLNEADFTAKTKSYTEGISNELEAKKVDFDTAFVNRQRKELVLFEKENLIQYEEQQKINKALGKGNPSPEFTDYVNYRGGTSSLKDYRGSYVYIDVWATWCGPCKYEIPFLEKVEKEYHDKNIKFVSLSIDNLKDESKWRAMIKDKDMSGIQLLADKDYDSQFIRDYFIYGIPRFILIDTKGNIVNYDAPRPSEEKLKTLFNSLDI